jgi:hypothetical protein
MRRRSHRLPGVRALVFATFYMAAMLPLRLTAIASNRRLHRLRLPRRDDPIVLLYVGLLPLNVWRLWQTLRQHTGGCAFRMDERGAGR